jgi:hypothetical protein
MLGAMCFLYLINVIFEANFQIEKSFIKLFFHPFHFLTPFSNYFLQDLVLDTANITSFLQTK